MGFTPMYATQADTSSKNEELKKMWEEAKKTKPKEISSEKKEAQKTKPKEISSEKKEEMNVIKEP